MSFVEFRQQDDGTLIGVSVYEANPEWELTIPSGQQGLVHPLVRTDEGSGTWIVFDVERNLWGALVRSSDAPFNDCLPPGETPFLDSFREGSSLQNILDTLSTKNEDSFVNPFEAILGDRGSDRLRRFHGSFQSNTRKLPTGQYRLDDRKDVESLDEEWYGFSEEPDPRGSMEELLESVSLRNIENHRSPDGMRTLQNVFVFRWGENLDLRTKETLESSTDWKDPLLPAP